MSALLAAWAFAKAVGRIFPPKVWAVLIAVAVLVIALGIAFHKHGAAEYARGKADAEKVCAAREKAAQEAHDREVKKQEDENRAREQEQATELAVAGANYEKELQDAEDQRKRDVAAARSGALKLRVAGMCPDPSGDRAAPEAAAPAGQRDGPSSAELPAAVTRDLLGLADDADNVVRQLAACQAIVNTYQKGKT